jgi:DNA-binding MarR family transcriptional regulator
MTNRIEDDARAVTFGKVIGNGFRVRLLAEFEERSESPSNLARSKSLRLGNVNYHTKELLKRGAVEVVKRRPAKGGQETYYGLTKLGREISKCAEVIGRRRRGSDRR